MCHEGKESVDSRIVLKCWIDENLSEDVVPRVSLNKAGLSESKIEFSLYAPNNKQAIVFFPDKYAIGQEKVNEINNLVVAEKIHALYVTQILDANTNGQYPESFMRIQDVQGYVVMIDSADGDYSRARIKVVTFYKNIDGFYQAFAVSEDNISKYSLINNELKHGNKKVTDEKTALMAILRKNDEDYHERRAKEEKERAERIEAQRKQNQIDHQQFLAEQKRIQEEKKLAYEAKEAAKKAEAERIEAQFLKDFENDFDVNDHIIRDAKGNRWLKCVYCGKKGKDGEFVSYGGSYYGMAGGRCKECDKKPEIQAIERGASASKSSSQYTVHQIPKDICPECGGRLTERKGPYGTFIGCKNYPDCRYNRKHW